MEEPQTKNTRLKRDFEALIRAYKAAIDVLESIADAQEKK